MAGNINLANVTDYQYDLYSDYLDQVDDILIKRGQQTGLSIEYWHIRVDLSKNFDDLHMQNAYKHYVYDLYHFVPTINASPLTYQIGYDPTKAGTTHTSTGSFSIYLIDDPLPGDIFRFYPHDGVTERTEIFRITNVRYMRTSKNKLKLYEVDYETAPMFIETLEHVRINEIRCWDTENFRFLNEVQCNAWQKINECRDALIECLNKWYDPQNGWYGICPGGPHIPNGGYPEDSCCGGPIQTGEDDVDDLDSGSEIDPNTDIDDEDADNIDAGDDVDEINNDESDTSYLECYAQSTAKPLVFLNTILRRLKKLFPSMDIQPIYGIGTAKIPIKWGLTEIPVYTGDPEVDPIMMPQDYWDTFTCLSFQPNANEGEIFNMTRILAGECEDCPPELVQDIECHRELLRLTQKLIDLMLPVISQEDLEDKTCDRRCCDEADPNYIYSCLRDGQQQEGDFNIFWDVTGPAGSTTSDFCNRYENAACIPLYISWKDGAVWPTGAAIGGGGYTRGGQAPWQGDNI